MGEIGGCQVLKFTLFCVFSGHLNGKSNIVRLMIIVTGNEGKRKKIVSCEIYVLYFVCMNQLLPWLF